MCCTLNSAKADAAARDLCDKIACRFSPLTRLVAVVVALPSNVPSTTTKPTWPQSFAAFALLNKCFFVTRPPVTRGTCVDNDDALAAATFCEFVLL